MIQQVVMVPVAKITCSLNEWLEQGPVIVRRHSVIRLTIKDKVPTKSGSLWTWSINDGHREPNEVPSVILGSSFKQKFQSNVAASEFLAEACIQWAAKESSVISHFLPSW